MFLRERRRGMSEKDIGEVRFELDPFDLPRMSEDRMAALRAMKDGEIDCNDTPEQRGEPTRRVFGSRLVSPHDVIALEGDVLDFFRGTGDSSSTRINAVLREYAEAHRKSA